MRQSVTDMTSTRDTTEGAPPQSVVLAIGVLTAVGACYWLLVYLTSEPPEGDFFDSPLYWPGWVALPAVCALAGRLRPHRAAAAYGVAALLPQAVAVVILGAGLHNPEFGASLWPVGLFFVLVHMALAGTAAAVASGTRRQAS